MSAQSGIDAVVRDVGYAGYDGPRSVDRAWRVLAEHTARTLWARTGVRRALMLAWLPALVCIIQIFVESKGLGGTPGARLPLVLLTKPYGVLFPTLIIATIAAGGTLAEDRRGHAFSFYFARPLAPRDYLFGRLLGVLVVMSIAAAGPPVAVALFRLSMISTGTELAGALTVTGIALVLGAALSLALTLYALLGGALTESRGAAQSFVALAFVLPWMCAGLGDKLLEGPWLSLLSLPDLMTAIGHAAIVQSASSFSAMLYASEDSAKELAWWMAVPALGALLIAPFVVLRARVARLGASGGEGGDA